jgi:peptidoglycan/xylan/chitin deacetylase (PgdA/CDA1 family)
MNLAQHLRQDRLAIFLFHGVVEKSDYEVRNYTRKHLMEDEFKGAVQGLTTNGCPLSMDDVVRHHQEGTPFPENAFAITFDDGFENNLTVAAPILEDFSVPATFYVTTDFIANNRMSWIDRIEWAVEAVNEITVQLPWSDRSSILSDADSKRAFLDNVRKHVKSNFDIDADRLASDVQKQCGLEETWSAMGPLDQKLTWKQTRILADHPLFTVGGHTHTHAILSFLNSKELAVELDTGMNHLRENASIDSHHYSYPEGLAHCYSDAVIEALKERGVVCCPTAQDGYNTPGTDLFHLKRIFAV